MTKTLLSDCCGVELLIGLGYQTYRHNEEHNIQRGKTYYYVCPKCDTACNPKEDKDE